MGKTRTLDPAAIGLVHNIKQHIPTISTEAMEIPKAAKLKFEVLRDHTIELNHKSAAAYCDLPIFPGEREVQDSWVQRLYDEMQKGNFNHLLVTMATALHQNTVYKINGQHTAWAMLYMPENFSMTVREINFKVHNPEQLRLLYATFDRIKPRSDSHIAKVHLVDTAAAEGLWASLISSLSSAFKFWFIESRTARSRIAPEQVAAMIQREFGPLFQTVGKFYQDNYQGSRKLIGKIHVMAAVFATYHKAPAKAREFWQPVVDGLELTKKTDARWALREFLKSTTTGLSRSTNRPMPPEDIYRVCVGAWNKWRRDQEVRGPLRPTSERIKPV